MTSQRGFTGSFKLQPHAAFPLLIASLKLIRSMMALADFQQLTAQVAWVLGDIETIALAYSLPNQGL